MKVTYKDHMGTDLSVVNAARVSFGKESAWEGECIYCKDTMVVSKSPCPEGYGRYACILGDRHLSSADKGLVGFLARGCETADWEDFIDSCELGSEVFTSRKEIDQLLHYIRNMPPHWTPFGHCQITLHLKIPLFVTRQINKHQTGFVINEVSRRYVTTPPEFYQPEVWRKAAENVKQGSSDQPANVKDIRVATRVFNVEGHMDEGELEADIDFSDLLGITATFYRQLIDRGVCAEQARMVLPQSMYTEFWMTGSLYGWARLYIQRSESHAQEETQEVAEMIRRIIAPLYPVSWKALTRNDYA